MAAPRPSTDAQKKFNRLVGNRTGRPSTPSRHVSTTGIKKRRALKEAGAGKKAISTYVQHGGGKVSARTRREHKQWFGSGAESTVDPISGSNKAFENIYNTAIADYNRQVLDTKAIHTEYANKVMDQATSPEAQGGGFVEVNGEQVPVNLASPISESYMGSNIYKYGLEPLQRPLSAIAGGGLEMMKQVLEDTEADKGNWEEFTGELGAFGSGFKEGITGKTHHGTGDVYELIKNEFKAGAPLRSLEEHAPAAEQAIAVGAGLTGDIALDPTGTLFGGGKAGVINKRLANPENSRRYLRELADKWAADVETNVVTGAAKAPGGYRVHPSEQAIADSFYDSAEEALSYAENQVLAGGSRGRYEVHTPSLTAGIVGARGSESLLKSMTVLFEDRVQRLVDGLEGRGTKLNGNAIDAWASNNPDFTEFLGELANKLNLPPGSSSDVLAQTLNKSHVKDIREIYQGVVDARYTPYVTEAANAITREFRAAYYNTPAVRVAGITIPIKPVGKAYQALGVRRLDGVSKNFRYNSVFPGTLGLDTTKARAWGVRATEDFEDEIRRMGREYNISKAEDIEIKQAIENNTVHTLDPRLKTVADWAIAQQKYMFEDEFAFGARGRIRGKPGVDNSTTPYDPNYTFVHNKGGTLGDRDRFKVGRKRTIHKNARAKNGHGAGRFKTENAKSDGLRPVEGIFESLRQRRIKHNRDMTRAVFLKDMVDKYGIHSKISPKYEGYAAQQRGLEQVNFSHLPEDVRVLLDETGDDVYLPKEMAQMINTFDDITKWHPGHGGRIQRSFAEIMRVIKKSQTLPWLGFHNKNMIGDVFMALLDGVGPLDYTRVLNSARKGGGGMMHFLKQVPVLDDTLRNMWRKYESVANSGFSSAEIGDIRVNKYNFPKKILGRAETIARDFSTWREDIGRFTHFVTAYRQELKELYARGTRDPGKLDEMATNAALWRVNNYKFDYNALMLWEKQAKTLWFPFYTFMRKAAPTLVQALYQDPRWINASTRFMYNHTTPSGEEGANFDPFRVPDHIRDIGHAFIGGRPEEPWVATNDLLPTSVFNSVRTENPHEFFNSLLSQTALPFQMAIEQGTGRQTFLDMPLEDQGIADYVLNKLPGTREVKSLLDPEKSWPEKFVSNRFFGGLPIHPIGEDQQLQSLREWEDILIDKPIDDVNKSQDVFYIATEVSQSGQANIYTVKNMMIQNPDGSHPDLQSFYTAEEAIQYVQRHLPDSYKKVDTTMDVDNQGHPYLREIGG